MLADDIITLLSNEGSSLSEALLKTKVFLHDIGKKELLGWVAHELDGYPEGIPVPSYRVLESTVMGDLMNPGWMANARRIPILHLKIEQRANLETFEARDSLRLVEELATKPNGSIRRPIPPEVNALLSDGLGNGWHVQTAWCDVNRLGV